MFAVNIDFAAIQSEWRCCTVNIQNSQGIAATDLRRGGR